MQVPVSDPRKVVVITGASAGIGRATATAFARHGWRVALLARSGDGLDAAGCEVEKAGGVPMILEVDVANREQVDAAAATVVERWGVIDVWVNNAMATVFSRADAITPEDFERVTDVTYLGTVWGTMAALRHMQKRNEGVIVQVGSALAYRSIPLQSAYCGAKSAARGFTDALRSELLHDQSRIALTMVHLAAFNTPQFDIARNNMSKKARPMGTVFQPDIAAQAIYHAAQAPRREFWIGWPAVQAILGTRILPGYLDKKMARDAYEGQLTDEEDAQREDNLYTPISRDVGAYGRFNREAKKTSIAAWVSRYKFQTVAIAVSALAVLMVAAAD